MTKKKPVTPERAERAKRLLTRYQQQRNEEFKAKQEALLKEYNMELTARFQLFGQIINPPIIAVPKPE